MERLTIDEIIAHCKRRVRREEALNGRDFFETELMGHYHMQEYWEHRQVAEYLEELKEYRKAEEQGLLVEVIRCKDCKHFCGGGLWDNGHWCGRTARPGECDRVTENDFCSKAEAALAEKGGA